MSILREAPPSEGQKPDAAAYMQGTSVITNVNRLFVGGALGRGFVVGYAVLPKIYSYPFHPVTAYLIASPKCLKQLRYVSFFPDVSRYPLETIVIPTPEPMAPLLKYTAFSIKNYIQLFNTMEMVAMKNGETELANGTVISREGERQPPPRAL
jgi:hypothetical protein